MNAKQRPSYVQSWGNSHFGMFYNKCPLFALNQRRGMYKGYQWFDRLNDYSHMKGTTDITAARPWIQALLKKGN